MNTTLKTSIIAVALAGGGAIGLGSIAAASYGDEPPTLDESIDDSAAVETDADSDADEAPGDDVDPAGLQATSDDAEEASEADREGGCRGGVRNSEAVADALGITTDELQAARGAGQSLADIATAEGVSIDVVVDAIVDDVEEHLAEEVAEGDLTQEEADERLAAAEERATEKVNADPAEGAPQGLRGFGGRRGPAAAPADA